MHEVCPHCGHQVSPDDRFCSVCGTALFPPPPEDATGLIAPVMSPRTTPDGTPSGTAAEVTNDSGPLSVLEDPDAALPPGVALLVVRRGPNTGTRFVLEADHIVVGRSADSEIFLDDITVSRRHAVFGRQGEEWRLCDDDSLNGTYVNRQRIEAELVLLPGDEIQIGKYRFTFHQSAVPGPPQTGNPNEGNPDAAEYPAGGSEQGPTR